MGSWYNVTHEEIRKFGGGGLLDKYYSNSPAKALKSIFWEHTWDSSRLSRMPTLPAYPQKERTNQFAQK